MDFSKQNEMAAESHKHLAETGMTCIDCHQGIAHTLPKGH
jgi:cytochrome c-type protein NapC